MKKTKAIIIITTFILMAFTIFFIIKNSLSNCSTFDEKSYKLKNINFMSASRGYSDRVEYSPNSNDSGATSGEGSNDLSIGSIFEASKKFIDSGKNGDENSGINPKEMGEKFGKETKPIIKLLISLGVVAAIAGGMVIGVKYMMAASSGDTNQMAKLKTVAIEYSIAVILLGGAYAIFSTIVRFFAGLFGYN